MHPSRTYVALVAYSSTSDVLGAYRTEILGCRDWVWMHIDRHLDEQELGLVRSSL